MLRQRLRAWRPITDEAYLEGLADLTSSNASDDGQQSAAPRVFLARYLPLDGAMGTASTQLPNDSASHILFAVVDPAVAQVPVFCWRLRC